MNEIKLTAARKTPRAWRVSLLKRCLTAAHRNCWTSKFSMRFRVKRRIVNCRGDRGTQQTVDRVRERRYALAY